MRLQELSEHDYAPSIMANMDADDWRQYNARLVKTSQEAADYMKTNCRSWLYRTKGLRDRTLY